MQGNLRSTHDNLGTATWSHPLDVADRHSFAPGDLWLGRLPVEHTPIGQTKDDENHVFCMVGSRGGKGAGIIIPNICLWLGSVVVIDPKGENAAITAQSRAERLGQKVYVLDPLQSAQVPEALRASFNPLAELRMDDPDLLDKVGIITTAIVIDDTKTKDPYWKLTARSMLTALILHVISWPDYEGKRNLGTVRKLLRRGDFTGAERQQRLLAKGEIEENEVKDPFDLLWQAMTWSGHYTRLGESELDEVVGTGLEMQAMLRSSNQDHYISIKKQLTADTDFLRSRRMQEAVASSSFDLADLKNSPQGISVYLCLPQQTYDVYFRWLRMMINCITSKIQDLQGTPACGHRTLMVLDEFAGLNKMEELVKNAPYVATYGLKYMFILHNISQMRELYGGNFETIIGSCSTQIYFSQNTTESLEFVSKILGNTTARIELASTSRTTGSSRTTSKSTSKTNSKGGSSSVADNESETNTEGKTRTETNTEGRSHGQTKSINFNKSVTANTSTARGQNRTSGISESLNRTIGSSDTTGENWGRSRGRTKGHSVSVSNATGVNKSTSEGENKSVNESYGMNSSHGFSGLSFSSNSGRSSNRGSQSGSNESRTQGYSKTKTKAKGKSGSETDTTSRGGNRSHTDNQSTSHGTGRNNTVGDSRTDTIGQGRTDGVGVSQSMNEAMNSSKSLAEAVSNTIARTTGRTTTKGESWNQSEGHTTSTSDTVNQSDTEGKSESAHVRPLLTETEIELIFGPLKDKSDWRYPGYALIKLRTEEPFVVRRSNYFEDPFFEGLYGAHPDHGYLEMQHHTVDFVGHLIPMIAATEPHIEITFANDSRLAAGAAMMVIVPFGNMQEDDPRAEVLPYIDVEAIEINVPNDTVLEITECRQDPNTQWPVLQVYGQKGIDEIILNHQTTQLEASLFKLRQQLDRTAMLHPQELISQYRWPKDVPHYVAEMENEIRGTLVGADKEGIPVHIPLGPQEELMDNLDHLIVVQTLAKDLGSKFSAHFHGRFKEVIEHYQGNQRTTFDVFAYLDMPIAESGAKIFQRGGEWYLSYSWKFFFEDDTYHHLVKVREEKLTFQDAKVVAYKGNGVVEIEFTSSTAKLVLCHAVKAVHNEWRVMDRMFDHEQEPMDKGEIGCALWTALAVAGAIGMLIDGEQILEAIIALIVGGAILYCWGENFLKKRPSKLREQKERWERLKSVRKYDDGTQDRFPDKTPYFKPYDAKNNKKACCAPPHDSRNHCIELRGRQYTIYDCLEKDVPLFRAALGDAIEMSERALGSFEQRNCGSQHERLITKWFGEDLAASHLERIHTVLKNTREAMVEGIAISCDHCGCKMHFTMYAMYGEANSFAACMKKVRICSPRDVAGCVLHELTHSNSSTTDHGYWSNGSYHDFDPKTGSRTNYGKVLSTSEKIVNADTYARYFMEFSQLET